MLSELLAENEKRLPRERLTLIRLFDELRGLGYEGGYDAVRRYGRSWQRAHEMRQDAAYAYLMAMLSGAVTAFIAAKQPVSYGFGAVTILLLLAGYGIGCTSIFDRSGRYLETIFLTMTVFLLMLPAATEALRGGPIRSDRFAG